MRIAGRRHRVATMRLCLLGICAWLGFSCGCARYAATSNHVYEGEHDRAATKVLSASEQSRLHRAMSKIADDHKPARAPSVAAQGIRWSDVPTAVFYAVAEVEMAIVSDEEFDWGWEYQLLTIEDYPGVLRVKRTNDEHVYEATAKIGQVVDHPTRAEALLTELHQQMLAFGRKKSLAGD
jgi:hypothetical protein